MDLALREHGGLRTEALDDAAHEWTYIWRGHQHWRFSFARGFFEALAHERYEFRQARWLHRRLTIVALTDERFTKRLLPPR